MGYDIQRFEGEVDEELICPICTQVLEEPVQAPQCEHAFCQSCINEWLTRQSSCPVDRTAIVATQLKPVPRILRNLLYRLSLTCENKNKGCTAVLKLDQLQNHYMECEFNPKKPVHCEQGCGLVVPKDELTDHNCVRELRVLVTQQQCKITELQTDNAEVKLQMNELKREVQTLKDYMRQIRSSNPRGVTLGDGEEDEVRRWLSTLTTARITRWGGMISTPDAVLQAVIKRALIESNCPSQLITELMENAHERRWPPGLCTLETRQQNRRLYETIICKRIPDFTGKQAVVAMACENAHVDEDLIMEPGLIMIFAHGVE